LAGTPNHEGSRFGVPANRFLLRGEPPIKNGRCQIAKASLPQFYLRVSFKRKQHRNSGAAFKIITLKSGKINSFGIVYTKTHPNTSLG
jgi:hypothetical protein